ncbi:hypothetical protein [Nonomuraea sp. NPDC002799]
MDLIEPNVSAPMQAADHDAAIRAWLRLDIRDRQLSVLRNTFPRWHISYALDPDDRWVWTARTGRDLTSGAITTDVLQVVHRGNPVELMAALTYQAWLTERATRPRP